MHANSPRRTVTTVICWLVAVNLFALFALNRFELSPDKAYRWIELSGFRQQQSWNLIGLHQHWDGDWYADIAQNGYRYVAGQELSNVVFFPLYPALIAPLALVLFGNFALAGWLISVTALTGSAIVLSRLIRRHHPSISEEDALLYLLAFPTAFFLNAVYTESLFLLLSVLTFYFLLEKRWWAAAIVGAVASATRVTGVLLVVPAGLELIRIYGWRSLPRHALPLAVMPMGLVAFFIFHAVAFGNGLLFFLVEKNWGRAFRFNPEHFDLWSHAATTNFALDVLFFCVAVVATVMAWRKLRVSYGAYMAVSIVAAVSTGSLMSIGRYVLVLFPLYLVLAGIKRPGFRTAWLFASTLLLAANIALFVGNGWAG